jgi:pyruvate dehydrogenase E2 component (dihydrolipoamide acetyltransferase)
MADVVYMPKLGFDMAEGVLVRWVVAEGESIEKGQVIAEIETDKATVEVESMISGVIYKHLISEGTSAPVGKPIAVVGEAGEEIDIEALVQAAPQEEAVEETVSEKKAEATEMTRQAPKPEGDGHLPDGVRASPVARRMAEDHNIDIAGLSGSGPRGRIVKQDVEEAIASPGRPAQILPAAGETVRIPVSKLRATIGRRMVTAKQELPHFYLTIDVDAAPLMAMRSEWNEILPEEEKLSVNDFIIKATALALREFPNLNASLDQDVIVRHGEINVGVAVAVEDGLLTAVVRNTDVKSIPEISAEVRLMVSRIRDGKVRPQDIEGSTFTVSNLGMFGIDRFVAIINPPEAAILAIGSVQQKPVVADGKIVSGYRLQCTLSADHRVTDGAEAARWLQTFRKYMEQPLRLLPIER